MILLSELTTKGSEILPSLSFIANYFILPKVIFQSNNHRDRL